MLHEFEEYNEQFLSVLDGYLNSIGRNNTDDYTKDFVLQFLNISGCSLAYGIQSESETPSNVKGFLDFSQVKRVQKISVPEFSEVYDDDDNAMAGEYLIRWYKNNYTGLYVSLFQIFGDLRGSAETVLNLANRVKIRARVREGETWTLAEHSHKIERHIENLKNMISYCTRESKYKEF